MFGDRRKQRKRSVLLWMLLNFVLDVHAKDVSFCFKSATHYNMILSGGLEAGKYKPWEPSDESHMTHDRCTEHCCKSPDTDVVFLLNSHCFCVKCHSVQLCSLKRITPPSGYDPVTVTVEKRISKLSTTTKPFSDTRIFRRTQPTESSTQSTTVKLEQKDAERRTTEPEDVTTKSSETTSDDGLRRRTGEDNANLEVRNAHLPVLNGYSKPKDAPKSEAITSFSGIHSEPSPTTANIDINITTPNITSTGRTTPRPTRIVNTEKKADGTGNDDISLQCPGTITVIRVRAFGIPGDGETIKNFNEHCQANLAQVDSTNVCIISLKRVYKANYPPFIKTLVTYTCSYTEFVS